MNLNDRGQCYVCREKSKFETADLGAELAKLETALAELGENLETVYDELYIEQKRGALQKAGISHQRIEIQPEDLSIN